MNNLCAICGLPEADHHPFQSLDMPAGCQCDPGTWQDTENIRPICEEYNGDGTEYCLRCDHDASCHATWEETHEPLQ